jgi:hypothetical protein
MLQRDGACLREGVARWATDGPAEWARTEKNLPLLHRPQESAPQFPDTFRPGLVR